MKLKNPNILALIIGTILVVLFMWGNIFGGEVNYNPNVGTDDMMDTNIPFRKFLNESYREGKIPIWSSLISSGYPILAEGQIAALYPINYLTSRLDPVQSYNASLFICYATIFIFSYLFFRELSLSSFVSIFGATIASFSGFPANEIQHLGMLTSYSLFVAILYLIEKEVKSGKFFYFLISGLILGLSILGGHPQIVFYGLLFIYPYWLIRFLSLNFFIKFFFVGFRVFCVVGVGGGAGQLLPQYEFTVNSTRKGGLTSESATRYSMNFSDLVTFVSPFANYTNERSAYGFSVNGWPKDEMYIFVGIIPVLLLIPSLLQLKKNRFATIFTVTLVLAYFFSMGGKFIFGSIMTLPPFSFFRIPFRINFLTATSIAYLSALGLEKLTEKKVLNSLTYETTDENYKRVRIISAVLLTLFSFINIKDNFGRLYSMVDAKKWYQEPEVIDFLKDNLRENERVTSELYFYASYPYFVSNPAVWNDPETHRNLRNLIPPFSALIYDIPQNVSAANSGGLKIGRYNDLEEEIHFDGWEVDEKGNFSVKDSFLFLNRIMGVKYILSNKQFSTFVTSLAKKIELPEGEAPIYVYEFFDYFPRQFMVPRAEKEEPEKIKEHLLKADFEPLQKIFIEEDSDWGAKGGYSANSQFVKYKDTEVIIKTQASGDGYLFLSDTYYPGWKAYVDGKEEHIYLANYAFRAVRVPEGVHEVTFKYEPDSVKWGISISLGTTAAALVAILAIELVEKKRLSGKLIRSLKN